MNGEKFRTRRAFVEKYTNGVCILTTYSRAPCAHDCIRAQPQGRFVSRNTEDLDLALRRLRAEVMHLSATGLLDGAVDAIRDAQLTDPAHIALLFGVIDHASELTRTLSSMCALVATAIQFTEPGVRARRPTVAAASPA